MNRREALASARCWRIVCWFRDVGNWPFARGLGALVGKEEFVG